MRGGHPSPPRPNLLYILATWICSTLAISALYAVSYYTDSIMIMAPFGATCVLVFGAPDSPLAQPRNVIGGHLVATVGAIILVLCGVITNNFAKDRHYPKYWW